MQQAPTNTVRKKPTTHVQCSVRASHARLRAGRRNLRLGMAGGRDARLAAAATAQAVLLGLQLLDEVAAGLVEVGVDEVEVEAHAERHGHAEALLELDAVFAVAAPAAGRGLGRAAGPRTGLVARGRGARMCGGRGGGDEVGACGEHVVVVGCG